MDGADGDILLAFAIFALGAASPGPANLAIAATSLAHGRFAGVSIALGVLSGSLVWGVIAAFWLTAATARFPDASGILRWIGALYLTWLGVRSLMQSVKWKHDAAQALDASTASSLGSVARPVHHYLIGLGIHLTNPKAVLVWSATILIGAPDGATRALSFSVVVGCTLLGAIIFVSYATLFSSRAVVERYMASKSGIDLIVGCLFLAAGVGVLSGGW